MPTSPTCPVNGSVRHLRYRRGRHARAFVLLVAIAVGGAGPACRDHSGGPPNPRPRAARAPVTAGILVQLRLAVEGLDSTFADRAEELDLLPPLVHAAATFYGWPDPAGTSQARLGFVEALCRARLDAPPPDLYACLDGLRLALYADLLAVTRDFRRAGHPDKIGEHSLKQLEQDFRTRHDQLVEQTAQRRERRREHRPFFAKRCDVELPDAPVAALGPSGVLLNGFSLVPGQAAGAEDWHAFQKQVEARLAEARLGREGKPQLIVSPDERTAGDVLVRVLGQATEAGVDRVCLKVLRTASFRVPCCLPLALFPNIVRPSDTLRVDGARVELILADGADPVPVAPGAAALRAALARRVVPAKAPLPPILVRPSASTATFVRLVEDLLDLSGGQPIEVIAAWSRPPVAPLLRRGPLPDPLDLR